MCGRAVIFLIVAFAILFATRGTATLSVGSGHRPAANHESLAAHVGVARWVCHHHLRVGGPGRLARHLMIDRVRRWLKLAVAVLAATVVVALAPSTTLAGSSVPSDDAPSTARIDVPSFGTVTVADSLLGGVKVRARHLEGTGLSAAQVESTILKRVTTEASQASTTGSFWGRVQISGTTIEYRAYTLPDGTINVGSCYVP